MPPLAIAMYGAFLASGVLLFAGRPVLGYTAMGIGLLCAWRAVRGPRR